MTPTTRELRAGMALLGWRDKNVAYAAGQPLTTIYCALHSDSSAQREKIARILRDEGVRFIPGGAVYP